MKTFSLVAAFLLILCTISPKATAWLRPHFADATVVERANLVVVGHIERGSIEVVPHAIEHGGRSWHHTARLAITTTLKGSAANSTIPIYIAYGLTPIVGDTWTHPEIGATFGSPNTGRGLSKDRIEIMDTGNSAQGFDPLVDDAGKDNIWFLRKDNAELVGIHDPEDVQPLSLDSYFESYLAANSESAVRSFLWKNPEVAQRAQEYLDHLEVQRIKTISDPTLRAQRLLPYYLLNLNEDGNREAREAIIGCGQAAGPVLLGLFVDYMQSHRRSDVIEIWATIDFKDAVPLLIDMLTKDNEYVETWQMYDAEHKSKREPGRFDRERGGNDVNAVRALHKFRDPRAREAIEETLALCKNNPTADAQLMEACETALRDLATAASN